MENDKIIQKIKSEKEEIKKMLCGERENRYVQLFKLTHEGAVFVYRFDEALKATYDLSSCWYCENKNDDAFYRCDSLDDILNRYRDTKWFMQRVEQGMYDENLEKIYEYIVDNKITMSMVTLMINTYLNRKEETFFFFVELLNALGDKKRLLQLYLYNIDNNPSHKVMHLGLASLFLEFGKIDKAIETLQKLEDPDEEIQRMIVGFQEMIG